MNPEQMANVQIAIQDRVYAEELRRLLVADGNHQVHVVERPITTMAGVVVVDEKMAKQLTLSERYVIFMGQPEFQAQELFEAGVRYVIHADCAPHLGRLIVLAAESQLNQRVGDGQPSHGKPWAAVVDDQPEPEGLSMFDETDRAFLRALRIADRLKAVLTKPLVAVQLDTRITETIPCGAIVELSQSSPRGWAEICWDGSWFSVSPDDLRDASGVNQAE